VATKRDAAIAIDGKIGNGMADLCNDIDMITQITSPATMGDPV